MYIFLVKFIIYMCICVYIFMDGAVVDGRYVNVWTRFRGRIFVDEVFNLTRGFVDEISWTKSCGWF